MAESKVSEFLFCLLSIEVVISEQEPEKYSMFFFSNLEIAELKDKLSIAGGRPNSAE